MLRKIVNKKNTKDNFCTIIYFSLGEVDNTLASHSCTNGNNKNGCP